MKKNVLMLLLLFSCFLIGKQEEKYDTNCSIFLEGEEEENEGKYYLDAFTGRTNIKFEDGKYNCEMGNSKVEMEVRKGKIMSYKETSISDGELLFSANYGIYGPEGIVYINKGFGWGYAHSMKLTYEKGKAVGEFIEYYSNGSIYRKSKLRRGFFYNYFGVLDYTNYIDGDYEIYDYNTGKLIYTGNITKGTGKMFEYTDYGVLYSEYELKKGKLDGKKYIYNDNKEIRREEEYVKGEIVKVVDNPGENRSETIYKNRDIIKRTVYKENKLIFLHVIGDDGKYVVDRYKDGILIEREETNKVQTFYEVTGNLRSVRNYIKGEMKGEYKIFDLNGKLIYETNITKKDQEIKYISGVNNGEVLLKTINLEKGKLPKLVQSEENKRYSE